MKDLSTEPLDALLVADADALERASQSEEAALAFLQSIRWPAGPVCPRCSSSEVASLGSDAKRATPGKLRCRSCRYQFTWRSGTALGGDRSPPAGILRALAGLRRGEQPASVAQALEVALGYGTRRAASVVMAAAQWAGPPAGSSAPERVGDTTPRSDAPSTPTAAARVELGPEESMAGPIPAPRRASQSPVALVWDDLPPVSHQPRAPERTRPAVRVAVAAAAAIALAAILGLAVGRLTRSELTSAWFEGDELIEWVTTRESGEGYWDFATRHNREVAEAQAAAPLPEVK